MPSNNTADKPTVRYRILHCCEVGASARVEPLNHHTVKNATLLNTSPVVSYDPKTGVFETRNTRYVPGPFAEWPHGADCMVKPLTTSPVPPTF